MVPRARERGHMSRAPSPFTRFVQQTEATAPAAQDDAADKFLLKIITAPAAGVWIEVQKRIKEYANACGKLTVDEALGFAAGPNERRASTRFGHLQRALALHEAYLALLLVHPAKSPWAICGLLGEALEKFEPRWATWRPGSAQETPPKLQVAMVKVFAALPDVRPPMTATRIHGALTRASLLT